jgi:hypothetical protein
MTYRKRFRVAFTFAGEKRPFVLNVASILAGQFGQDSILYDKYHQAEFARAKLGFCLPKLYSEDSDLIVVVFCEDYMRKEWCGLEWSATYSLLMKNCDSKVLLTRFNRVNPEGLNGLAGFIDLDDIEPDQLVELIQEKLAINEGLNREFYKVVRDPSTERVEELSKNKFWPACVGPLEIKVANHKEPQEAFVRLLQPENHFRLLLIEGERLTGKTHLSKEFHGAAMASGIRCGRLDFKGTVDLDQPMRSFALQLDIPYISSTDSLASRLAGILQALIISPCPTVLLFDTYESAGEADGWVNTSLLVMMLRNPWLRVVISGQTTVASEGEAWSRCCNRIFLRLPTPDEWWDYATCCESKPPELTLDALREVYKICNGKSDLLAGIIHSRR